MDEPTRASAGPEKGGGEPLAPPALLSGDEALDRLKATLRAFFAWKLPGETERPVKRLLLRSPPGLGKSTSAMGLAVEYQLQQERLDADEKRGGVPLTKSKVKLGDVGPTGLGHTVIFAQRHELARELKTVIEGERKNAGAPVHVPLLRGRTNRTGGLDPPCDRWPLAETYQSLGIPIRPNLCLGKGGAVCPHFLTCEYLTERRKACDAPFVIQVHQIIRFDYADADEALTPYEDCSYGPQSLGFRYTSHVATTIICDEDPTSSLLDPPSESKGGIAFGAFRRAAGKPFGDEIVAGLRSEEGLLDYLRSAGVTAESLRRRAGELGNRERMAGVIASPTDNEHALSKAARGFKAPVRLKAAFERLADELDSGRKGDSYSMRREEARIVLQGRLKWPFSQARTLILDGTANPTILRQFIPDLEPAEEMQVRRNAHVVQVTDRRFPKGAFPTSNSDGEAAGKDQDGAALLAEIKEIIQAIGRTGKTLVVTYQSVRKTLTGETADKLPQSGRFGQVDVAHFGALRGVNAFEGHRNVIILGRNEPFYRDAEKTAMAIWYDTREPICFLTPGAGGHTNFPKALRPYWMADPKGKVEKREVSVHPDPRVQAVIENQREAESLQAIDRLRLIHAKPGTKYVYILCNIPLQIEVNELLTWNYLSDGVRTWERLLAEAERRGLKAIPLAAKAFGPLAADLLGGEWRGKTEKAVQQWLTKAPPAAFKGLISGWGTLVEYRPAGQTSWSTAVVGHGAEPKSSVAAVIGVEPRQVKCKRITQRL